MSEADILAQKEGFADAAEKEEVMRAKGDTDIIQRQLKVVYDCLMKQDTQGADNALHAVLASKEKVFGLEHPETLATVDQLAKLNLRIGDLKEAMTFFQREYDVQMSTLSGPADESVISTINSLASIHIKLGQLPEAEALFKKVADLKAQNFGPTDARVVSSYNNMGYVSCFQDKYPQAEEYFGKSDAIEEQGGIQPTIKAKDNIAYCQSKQ